MKFLDKFRALRQADEEEKEEEMIPSASPERVSDEVVASLWFSLCENPNQPEELPRLLSILHDRGGRKAETAALTQLAEQNGSWLPQVYLGRYSLEEQNFDEAMDRYDSVLRMDAIPDYALMMMSADFGRLGFASRVPREIEIHYDPMKHSPFIGLNLLQAYAEAGRRSEGRDLLHRMHVIEDPEIREYLEGFAGAFDDKNRADTASGKDNSSADASGADSHTGETHPSSGGKPQEDTATAVTPTQKLVSIELPLWGAGLIGLQDLFPNAIDRPRTGIYLYSVTTPPEKKALAQQSDVSAEEIAVALPLYLGERLMFLSSYKPFAMYPIVRTMGPWSGTFEPDVQGLFGLCSKEALDFLITGTVFEDGPYYRVRTLVLDRSKQSARVISKDIPTRGVGKALNEMAGEILSLFSEKKPKSSSRSEFAYQIPADDLTAPYLRSLYGLLFQYLVRQGECDRSCLPSPEAVFSPYARLTQADPRNPAFIAEFLCGMNLARKEGMTEYQNYRKPLYEAADKNRYASFIKAVMQELNAILQN